MKTLAQGLADKKLGMSDVKVLKPEEIMEFIAQENPELGEEGLMEADNNFADDYDAEEVTLAGESVGVFKF